MHADCLQLLAPGIRLRGLAAVGQHDRRAVGGVQCKKLQARFDMRRLRKQCRNVLGTDRLHIGNLSAAQMGEIFGGNRDFILGTIHYVCHGPRLLTLLTASSPCGFHYSHSLIAIDLTMRSGCGRARSIDSNPFFKSAPKTSIPSASTKMRWNCRAAMPRWMYWRLLSSFCRPRMTSWLSSIETSS